MVRFFPEKIAPFDDDPLKRLRSSLLRASSFSLTHAARLSCLGVKPAIFMIVMYKLSPSRFGQAVLIRQAASSRRAVGNPMQPCSERYELKKIAVRFGPKLRPWKLTKLATGSLEQPIAVRPGQLHLPTFWNDSMTRNFIVRRID
jgi:hypothetical protein